MTKKLCLLLSFMVALGAAPSRAFAQAAQIRCETLTAPAADDAVAASPSDIAPRGYERFFRAVKPFYQLVDNAEFLFAKDTEVPIVNPNEGLYRFGFTLSPGALFRTPEDVERGWTNLLAFHEAVKKVTVQSDPAPEALASGRGWGLLQKVLNGLTLGVQWSERNFIAERDELSQKDKNARTVTIAFDPSTLLADGAARKSGLAALAAYMKISPSDAALGQRMWRKHVCAGADKVTDCLSIMAPDTSRGSNVLWLIPSISYQTLDEFDFIIRGGRLVLPAEGFRDRFTETFQLTWDLSKLVNAGAANRSAAVAALKAYKDIIEARAKAEAAATPFALDESLVRPFSTAAMYYSRLVSKKDGAFTFEADRDSAGDLKGFPGVQLHQDGVLMGAPTGAGCGAEGCRFDVKVKSGDKPVAVCQVAVRQRS